MVSDVLDKEQVLPVGLGNQSERVGDINSGMEGGEWTALEEKFDLGIGNHEVQEVSREVVLGKTACQNDSRAV